MKRNSGIIGARLKTLVTSASGLFDTFDNYISRRDNSWPATIYYNSTSFNSGTINENTSQSITLNTQGILVNTTLFWTILHGNSIASDFTNSIVSGSFVQSSASNTGIFSFATAFTGNTSKTPKTFQIQIRTGSTGGPVVYTTGTYTIPTITITNLNFNPTTINENASSSLFFQCGNCGTNTTWNLTLTNTGTISASDISGGLPTTWTINPGVLSSRTYTTLNDFATEGTETLSIQVSFAGFNLGTAQTLTVNDTSLAPTSGTISPSTTSATEGIAITFTCTINNNFTGTAFFSVNNVTGTMSGADFSDGALTGSISFSNGNGSFTRTLVADGVAEGEAFSVSLRIGSTSGTIFATTATITVADAEAPQEVQFSSFDTYASRYDSTTAVSYRVPNFYVWTYDSGGTSGTQIGDGGGDMYDNGNALSVVVVQGGAASASIPFNQNKVNYGNDVFISGFPFHPQVRMCFVPKNVHFTIQETGDYGADGGGLLLQSTNNQLTVGIYNVTWSYMHVYNAGDPSICQVVFSVEVANSDSITLTLRGGTGTNAPNPSWNFGSSTTNRYIFHTLHSKTSGGQITTTEITNFITNFVTNIMA
jgi:hypothetical protein